MSNQDFRLLFNRDALTRHEFVLLRVSNRDILTHKIAYTICDSNKTE